MSIPSRIKPMLDEFYFELCNCLKESLVGLYLYNSIALGKYDEERSDIDFIVITKSRLSLSQVNEVSALHRKIYIKHSEAYKLEGVYVCEKDIGKNNSQIEPYPYYAKGILRPRGYYDLNYITWWSLSKKGIKYNSEYNELWELDIPFDKIKDNMSFNINKYWKSKLSKTFLFYKDAYFEFCVLTLCRIYYTLSERDVISKLEAGEFMLERVEKEHYRVVREAISVRLGKSSSSLAKIMRTYRCKKFLEYMIIECNTLLKSID